MKKRNHRNFEALIFGDKELEEVSSEDILTFLGKITDGRKQQTRRTRYSHLSAFFNFIINNIDERIQNPCANQLLKKLYKANTPVQWDSFEKEIIDEIIFRTTKLRNRLILELMARDGMRIGEVLTLTLQKSRMPQVRGVKVSRSHLLRTIGNKGNGVLSACPPPDKLSSKIPLKAGRSKPPARPLGEN